VNLYVVPSLFERFDTLLLERGRLLPRGFVFDEEWATTGYQVHEVGPSGHCPLTEDHPDVVDPSGFTPRLNLLDYVFLKHL